MLEDLERELRARAPSSGQGVIGGNSDSRLEVASALRSNQPAQASAPAAGAALQTSGTAAAAAKLNKSVAALQAQFSATRSAMGDSNS